MQVGTAVGNLAGVIGVRPEEAAVVEQLKAGSEEAFAWLISRYQQPLYSLIYRILPNPSDAADITQEVFDAGGEDHHASSAENIADTHESPFEAFAHAEIAARVEAALREVPEPFRTVVVLRDIEGFGYEEIAEILNANLGTVKSRLMRGRAHLKSLLAPYMEAANRRPSRRSSVSQACSAEEAI
jgi:RNA polymerase sigma-70 factor (ECF subfamily)